MLLQQLEISPLRSTKHACVYLEILQIDECMMQQLLFINLHSPVVYLKTRYLRKQNTEPPLNEPIYVAQMINTEDNLFKIK